ncbi:MAG TPA: transposase [Clostridiaceae bacterium]
MSKFFNLPVIGIDVSADFSIVAILAPNGDIYRKPFKVIHDALGFHYLIEQIKKAEEEYSMKSQLFMESTGIYHLTLFHFLKSSNLEAYSSPKAVLEAPKADILVLLKQHARRGIDWCTNTYNKLIKAFNEQIEALVSLIASQAESNETPKIFRDYMALLVAMPGIGFITAVTILRNRFSFCKEK